VEASYGGHKFPTSKRQPHNLLSKVLNEMLKRNGCSIENMDEMLKRNGCSIENVDEMLNTNG
jgi:hypothetical protein